MGSGTISLSCSECFSPFLHSTRSLSVSQEYLALPDGPGGFGQDSSCPDLLRSPLDILRLACTGLSPYIAGLSSPFHFASYYQYAVLLHPRCRNSTGLGFSPVARRYWGNHVCFLLLQVLRCFSSLRLPSLRNGMPSAYRVAPFGDPRINGHLHLPAAFRSLSRPSSPLRA